MGALPTDSPQERQWHEKAKHTNRLRQSRPSHAGGAEQGVIQAAQELECFYSLLVLRLLLLVHRCVRLEELVSELRCLAPGFLGRGLKELPAGPRVDEDLG
jgi:hypothetical protein